ncbi:hypothetical protein THAOC_32622 [Thalassiosira oceanica]|uniref:Uncharacterized protein n=1 Tax=Thalassiosira oceanica TaxID=159749 RepID=K0R6S4_THAOC|nr:hypothetical protein THAOC_32622 [Thalassiosira oceanica]|eukprot:EJK48570.1 hypothetical protein THAOC_32622 [Thalassiosira oceanica]
MAFMSSLCPVVRVVYANALQPARRPGPTEPSSAKMRSRSALLLVLLLASSPPALCQEDESPEGGSNRVDCPGKDEAFVTSCSGGGVGGERKEAHQADGPVVDDESDLVDEVLRESAGREGERAEPAKESRRSANSNHGGPRAGKQSTFADQQRRRGQQQEEPVCDASSDDESADVLLHKLRHNVEIQVHRYYDPLKPELKTLAGAVLGVISSRLVLGVASRLVRLAGAVYVLSEALHASGYCDESRCVPEEARPWLSVIKRVIVRQSVRVREASRRVWNEERIREFVDGNKDLAAGLAGGAFVGFVL